MSKITSAFKMDLLSPPSIQPHRTACDVNGSAATKNKARNDDDEYHTVFTKRLTNENNLNSTNSHDEVDHSLYHSCYSEDFIGGPISNEFYSDFGNQSLKNGNSNEESNDFNRSITMTPADSSCGFHNTFSVLEKHLNKSKQPKLSRQQIEYLLVKNKDSTVQNQIYVDIPIDDEQCLRTVSSLANGFANGSLFGDENETPSLFELEFEAMERLRSMWQNDEKSTPKASLNAEMANTTLNAADASLVDEEFYQQDDECSITGASEYIYHVARSRTGQLYIRVLRNLRLDKGKNSTIFFSFFSNW